MTTTHNDYKITAEASDFGGRRMVYYQVAGADGFLLLSGYEETGETVYGVIGRLKVRIDRELFQEEEERAH